MKFISWNVNGLRACVNKGFLDFFHEINADAFCIQETKLQEGQIDLSLPGYMKTTISSPATRQTPRANWQGFPTVWNGKMLFYSI